MSGLSEPCCLFLSQGVGVRNEIRVDEQMRTLPLCAVLGVAGIFERLAKDELSPGLRFSVTALQTTDDASSEGDVCVEGLAIVANIPNMVSRLVGQYSSPILIVGERCTPKCKLYYITNCV